MTVTRKCNVCKALQQNAAPRLFDQNAQLRWKVQRLQEGGSYELLQDAKHLVTGGKFDACVPAAFEDKCDNAVAPQACHSGD